MSDISDAGHGGIFCAGGFVGGVVGIVLGAMVTKWLANKSLNESVEACRPKVAYYAKATYVGGSEPKNNLMIEDYSGEKFLLLLGNDGIYRSLEYVSESTLGQDRRSKEE